MTIDITQIKKLARLSRLKFSEEEYENFKGEFSKIMEMIDQIVNIDCDGDEPLISVNDMAARMREDISESEVQIDELLSNAPGKDATLAKEVKCFVVPKVVE